MSKVKCQSFFIGCLSLSTILLASCGSNESTVPTDTSTTTTTSTSTDTTTSSTQTSSPGPATPAHAPAAHAGPLRGIADRAYKMLVQEKNPSGAEALMAQKLPEARQSAASKDKCEFLGMYVMVLDSQKDPQIMPIAVEFLESYDKAKPGDKPGGTFMTRITRMVAIAKEKNKAADAESYWSRAYEFAKTANDLPKEEKVWTYRQYAHYLKQHNKGAEADAVQKASRSL